MVSASSGAPRTFRAQLATDFFSKKDYVYRGDHLHYVGAALSLGLTPVEHLELSAAFTLRRLRDSGSDSLIPDTLHTTGDSNYDVKAFGEVARGIWLAGDASLFIHTREPDSSVDYAGASFGLRGSLSINLQEMRARVPLELRGNIGYVFDQTRKIVSQAEHDRLRRLLGTGVSSDTSGKDEVRQLATPAERLAYGVNRVDHTQLAIGAEAPFQLGRKSSLHLLAEWELWIPVNRQGYDCSRFEVPSSRQVGGQDRCLDRASAAVWPQRVTLGARLAPVPSFSLLAAVEVGAGGRKDFVRELAPVAPYALMFNAAYQFDYARAH